MADTPGGCGGRPSGRPKAGINSPACLRSPTGARPNRSDEPETNRTRGQARCPTSRPDGPGSHGPKPMQWPGRTVGGRPSTSRQGFEKVQTTRRVPLAETTSRLTELGGGPRWRRRSRKHRNLHSRRTKRRWRPGEPSCCASFGGRRTKQSTNNTPLLIIEIVVTVGAMSLGLPGQAQPAPGWRRAR